MMFCFVKGLSFTSFISICYFDMGETTIRMDFWTQKIIYGCSVDFFGSTSESFLSIDFFFYFKMNTFMLDLTDFFPFSVDISLTHEVESSSNICFSFFIHFCLPHLISFLTDNTYFFFAINEKGV